MDITDDKLINWILKKKTCKCSTPIFKSFFIQEIAALRKELSQTRDQLAARDEEIAELKAERSNTRVYIFIIS